MEKPTRVLAAEMGLSRNTVVAVYEQLKAEGYIDSKPGAGYFVLLHPDYYLNTQAAALDSSDLDKYGEAVVSSVRGIDRFSRRARPCPLSL